MFMDFVGLDLFFIYWILQWGAVNNGLSVHNWGANFAIHLAIEILLISLLRIFFINVFVIELLRPALMKIYKQFMNKTTDIRRSINGSSETPAYRKLRAKYFADGDESNRLKLLEVMFTSALDMSKLRIVQYLSPACLVASEPEYSRLVSSRVLQGMEDVDWYELRHGDDNTEEDDWDLEDDDLLDDSDDDKVKLCRALFPLIPHD